MKKKTWYNTIMVAVIAVIVAAGIVISQSLMETGAGSQLGTLFEKKQTGDEEGENICSVTVVCDMILQNQEKLNQAKAPYVPANGVVLEKTLVEFAPGETAFDVLVRACEKVGLQLEYSWTPLYDNYYVEGISHIYEFDCGPESGWMYKVNGVFPNYGCSSYELSNGDEIVWCYTCRGFGIDVGAEGMA